MDHLCYFCLGLLCLDARLFVDALWSPAGKGLTSWLSFVMSNRDVVPFSLVSWVRCGAWLHRFLIFSLFLAFILYALWKWKYCVYDYLQSLNLHSQIDGCLLAQSASSHSAFRTVINKQFSAAPPSSSSSDKNVRIWAVTCDFQQCGILPSVDSDEPVKPHFKFRNSKCCSVSS